MMSLVKEQDGRKVKKQEKRGMRRIELCKRRDEETGTEGEEEGGMQHLPLVVCYLFCRSSVFCSIFVFFIIFLFIT